MQAACSTVMVIAQLCLLIQELDELKTTHTQLRHAHAQLQEQHLELTEQHRQQTDASTQADMVSELTSEVQQARQDLAGQRAKTMALQQVCAHSLCAVLCTQPPLFCMQSHQGSRGGLGWGGGLEYVEPEASRVAISTVQLLSSMLCQVLPCEEVEVSARIVYRCRLQ